MGKQRKVKDIYRNSSSKGKFGRILFQVMKHYDLKNALELGTSLGVGTICMATGAPNATITTIEGCPETYQIAKKNFESMNLASIRGIHSTFQEALPALLDEEFDLIFIDGHHDGAALLDYMDLLFSAAHDDTFFILDDIRWSRSMKSAWETLKADTRFHVSIDLFRMGILVKRPQQEKEHFTILP
jgi:predicted O-methyltransferase YrrM